MLCVVRLRPNLRPEESYRVCVRACVRARACTRVTECDKVQQYASTSKMSEQKVVKAKKERFTLVTCVPNLLLVYSLARS